MKKFLEKKMIIKKEKFSLKFGKCFFEQTDQQQEFLKEFLLPNYENVKIHLDHSPNCPLKGLYTNKSKEEIQTFEEHFENLQKMKNKNISLASVGIIFDKYVLKI